MLISREREKLLNAIIYFAKHTQMCGKVKLFKLLYLLDFTHYQQTGRSVTGLDYFAWKMGPVPITVSAEFDDPSRDFLAAVEVVPEKAHVYTRLEVRARRAFNDTHFSRRELKLLGELAAKYRTKNAKQMVRITHEPGGPWARVYRDGEGENEPIAYALAADGPHSAELLEIAEEYQALRAHYRTAA